MCGEEGTPARMHRVTSCNPLSGCGVCIYIAVRYGTTFVRGGWAATCNEAILVLGSCFTIHFGLGISLFSAALALVEVGKVEVTTKCRARV